MTHRFAIKEIARQAGLGPATVDRVLNGRPHVSPQTRNRVAAALKELEAQESQLAARGRRLFVDVLVEAPRRFCDEIRAAADAVLSTQTGAAMRPRFVFQEIMSEAEVLGALERIRKRGSQGLCLKARDTPRVRAMVDRLAAGGIPVFTLVTDLPGSARRDYIGLDNANAGRTAAYLLARALGQTPGTVLTTRSQDAFFGETERYRAFRDLFANLSPGRAVVDVSGGAGLATNTIKRLSQTLPAIGPVCGVYSMGGGNAAILGALAAHRQTAAIYVAHDLDAENRRLLRDGAIDFVLHHDLQADMRALFGAVAAFHGLAPQRPGPAVSDIQVVTPFNLPAPALRRGAA